MEFFDQIAAGSLTVGDILAILGVVFLIALVMGIEQAIQKKPGSNTLFLVVATGGAVVGILQRLMIDEITVLGGDTFSPVIASGLLTGIGFLAAGLIIVDSKGKENKNIVDAALLWVTAILGLFVGMGYALLSITVLVFITVSLLIWRPVYIKWIKPLFGFFTDMIHHVEKKDEIKMASNEKASDTATVKEVKVEDAEAKIEETTGIKTKKTKKK